MLMSIGFSIIFYNTSIHQFGRQRPPEFTQLGGFMGRGNMTINQYLDERADDAREALITQIILVNVATLFIGAVVSYLLARRTMQPVEDNLESQYQFVSDASHELRTPLTTIRITNEVALRDKNLTLKEAKNVISGTVEDSIKLQNLTNSLLGLLSDDNHEINKRPVDLHLIASDAIKSVSSQALAKNITIDDKIEKLTVDGDYQSLVQLMTILLDNAIKYSPEGTAVIVSSEIRGKYSLINVSDQGCGIDEKNQHYIFSRFFRADTSRTKQSVEGYGLGLSIAKKIAESHNGKVTVQSTIGEGSTFSVWLPRHKKN